MGAVSGRSASTISASPWAARWPTSPFHTHQHFLLVPQPLHKMASQASLESLHIGKLETVGAGFVSMLMDRLQAVESDTLHLKADNTALRSKVAEMQRELDKRSPSIYLTQHSDFCHFNDGWEFSWDIHEEPEMVDQRATQRVYVPLDAAHSEAVVFPSGAYMQLPVGCRRYLGEPGVPLTVQKLVNDVQKWLAEPDVAADILQAYGDPGAYCNQHRDEEGT